MRVCIIGAAGHTKQAYRYLKTRKDVCFCGIAPGSLYETNVQSLDPSIPYYAHYKEMLDSIHPDLAIVSPVFGLTGEIVIECAKRGIDVFSEKPIAADEEMLSRVEAAVRESGIRFSAMHYLRFLPAFYRGAALLREGAIGEVQMVTAQKSYRYGTRPEWYGDRTLYGGTIPWVGIHAIDWIYHFTGKRFLSVSALTVGKDPEMAALCQFTLEGGAMASVNIDYYRPNGAPSHGDDRIRCAGTRGVLEVRDGQVILIDDTGVRIEAPTEAPELLERFLAGEDPIPTEELLYLTRVALRARASADLGKALEIEV